MIEREWREAADLHASQIGLAAVLVAAALLRFWGLGHGIPYSVNVDEPEIVVRAFNMMRNGTLNPNKFFDYPGLYIYIQLVVFVARFVTGAIAGAWSSLETATIDSFYLWGRAVSVVFGIATVALTYRIGARWGARHALLAAGLLAVMPLHVLYSHYVLTDTPLTFFVTLTMLLSLGAHEKGTLAAFAWAGVGAGLAAATKYNGGVAILMPLLACWMSTGTRRPRLICAFAIVAATAAAFLVAAPYTLLDLPGFLNGFARLANEYRGNGPLAEAPTITYLKHLRMQFGWPATVLVISGLIMGIVRIVRGPGRARWALVVTFPAIYFYMLSHQQIVYARYLLPLVPMLCVLAAAAVVSGVSLLRRYEIPRAPRTALIAALTISALLPPTLSAIGSVRTLKKRGTVDMAYEWVMKNLPRGSHVVLEARKMLLPIDVYRVDYMGQLRQRTYEDYAAENVDYLIASSQCYGPYVLTPEVFPKEYAEYMRIFVQSHELMRFSPSDNVPGPELRIFKVKP